MEKLLARYFVNSRPGINGVTVIFPNGNIGHGETVKDADFCATFFPLPPAAAPREETGWKELDEKGKKVFSK